MQPEILDTPQEQNPSKTSATPEVTPSAIASAEVSVPVEATPRVEKKRSGISLALIALVVCILLVFAGFAWVGYWAYQLSNDLTATQQQLSALQVEHEKLQADYSSLTGDNAKLNEDLTKAQSDLAAAQANVDKLQDESQKLNAKLKKATTLAEILNGFFDLDEFSSFVELDGKIKASQDSQLKGLWDEFADSPSEDSFAVFLKYLVPAIVDSLK